MKYVKLLLCSFIPFSIVFSQPVNFKYDRAGDFKEGMAQVFIGNQFGFIDMTGKEIIPPIYDDNYPHYEFKNGIIVLKKNKLLGIVDKLGKIVAPFEFNHIEAFSNGLAEASKSLGYIGFIDNQGKTVIPFQYKIMTLYGGVKYIDGMIPVTRGNKFKGYIDKTGKQIVPFNYETVHNFSDGLGLVKRIFNGKVSYVNNKGEIVIPEKYNNGMDFMDGFAAVNIGARQNNLYELTGGKWGVIDKIGKEVIPLIYDGISEIKNGFAIVYMGKWPNQKEGLIRTDGKIILPVNFYNIKILKNRIVANKEFTGPFALFDLSGNQIGDFKWHLFDIFPDFYEGLLRVQELKNNVLGKVGAIDENGNIKIPYSYNVMGPFKEGLAYVALNNKYGAIDKNGKVIIPLIYDGLSSFSEGWANVTKNGKMGFINKARKLMEFPKSPTPSIKKVEASAAPGNYQFKERFFDFFHVVNGAVLNTTTGEYSGAKMGILSLDNKVIVPANYGWIGIDTAIKAFFVYTGVNVTFSQKNPAKLDTTAKTRVGIIDYNGKQVYPQTLSAFRTMPNKYIRVKDALTKKLGVLDRKYTLTIPFKYDRIYTFTDSVIAAQQNGKFGIINLKNEIIMPFEYDTLYDGGTIVPGGYRIIKKGQQILIDSKGKIKKSGPEPQESKYQSAIIRANNSDERANAILEYYVALKQLGYSTADLETLLGYKFLQMRDIDFYGIYKVLISKKIKFDDAKLCMKASEVLTSEQRRALKLLMKYTIADFIATQNNTTKPPYPTGVPKPGQPWK